MSMIPRLDAAIKRLEERLKSIPLDERVPDNKDYVSIPPVLQSLRTFKATVVKMEEMLDRLGV